MREVCNQLGIEKRRSSAYHSQGNGFAERNIRSVKDMLRAALLDRKMSQTKWLKLLPKIVFALNTSLSKATKQIPYKVVFGRSPVLPQDITFGHTPDVTEDITATDYATETEYALQDIYDKVIRELELSKKIMQRQYNKKLRFVAYQNGQKVWLKVKHYKTGENQKLAPRSTGPFTVVERMPNGVNFRIINDENL